MRSDWRTVRLAELGRIVTGKTPPSTVEGCFGGSTPFVTPSDYDGSKYICHTARTLTAQGEQSIAGVRVPANSVMVTCIGSDMGKAALNAAQAFTNQQINSLIVESGDLPEYVYYNLSMRKNELRARASGSAQPILNKSAFGATEIEIPSPRAQAAIVEVLSALDNRIDLLRQTNATLESIAQALFKSWFIDFDPVRVKAEGREPEGMDAATAALFPAEFEESALGLIPRSWKVSRIREVIDEVFDGPHATPPEADEGPVFLGIKNLTGTSLDLSETRRIDEVNWQHWTRRVAPMTDDIVFSYEAALGLFALIPPGLRCCLGRRLALVRAKPVDGTPHFWFHQFIADPFQRLLEKHTVHGATVNRIALKEFPSYTVLDPGSAVRRALEEIAKPVWQRIHANQRQALGLAELRDTLLPRLISGKLRLPEAQEQLEDALA